MKIQKPFISTAEYCLDGVKACVRSDLRRAKLPILNAKKLTYVPENNYKFSVTDNEFVLLSPNGETLSSIVYLKSNNDIDILDIASTQQGRGYGTTLLKKFLDSFKDSKIRLAACWERIVSPKPPHKFYMQHGFIPTNKNAEQALKKWTANGAEPKDFPLEYELCDMVRIPKN